MRAARKGNDIDERSIVTRTIFISDARADEEVLNANVAALWQ